MECVSKNPEVALKIQWQWKSNPDPWSKTEEPQWESYSPEHNYLLEKASYEKKNIVDLGNYVISIQHMLQTKKGNITSQRSIRRKVYDEEEEEEEEEVNLRSERYFETELPKSINKVFGNLRHFISFFSRRNPEILGFTKQFQEFERTNDLEGLNKTICPQLICCLEEELLKPIEDQLKDHSVSVIQKKSKQKSKERHEKLISLFKKNFASFEEFYGLILKSYTMNTGLYMSLNKYLRNESWGAIDSLLPYAVCLCKAFFSLKVSQKDEKKSSIILYRGTGLDELALSSYHCQKASRFFSWNSVTSTSTNRKMAERFMYASAKIEQKKYPVLFVIEIPLVDFESEYLKWIDIRQYSAIPNEDEVILAPGSVFEIEQISIDQDKRTTIQIKLKHDVESLAHGGLIMQGAFQNEMMSDKQVKIVCLGKEELSETFKSLSGNRLIEEVEFSLCKFDKKSFEEMLEMLSTLENARGLKFISCRYENKHGISGFRLQDVKTCCKVLRVEIYDIQSFSQILCINDFWACLKTVEVDLRNLELNNLKYLPQLTSLTLHFLRCKQISNEGIANLASQELRYLLELTSLALDFAHCYQITDEGVNKLASQGLKYLGQLTSLTLNFAWCKEITDKGVNNLAFQGIKHLTQLSSLALHFRDCEQLTDGGIRNLASQGLRYLTKLTCLSLDFLDCKQIADKGINDLASQGLKHLTQLTSFALDISSSKLTDEGVTDLADQGFKYLTQLTSLTVHFPRGKKITNVGVKNLASRGLRYLPGLASLTLHFPECEEITDEGINNLTSQGLQHLTLLTSLTLNFGGCNLITTEGLKNFTSQGLRHLAQLTSLTLDFSTCEKVTDEGVETLASQGLKYLTQLSSLTLHFFGCEQITTEGINCLASQGIKHLTQLTSLTLDLIACQEITDEAMNNLVLEGFKFLTQLTSLVLDFSACQQLTNKGVNNLASEGLRYLAQLTFLNLSFKWCEQITNEALDNLTSQVVKYLPHVTTFILNERVLKQVHHEKIDHKYRNFGDKFFLKLIRPKVGGDESVKLKPLMDTTSELSEHLEIQKFFVKLMNLQGTTTLDLKATPTSLILDFSECPIKDEGVNNMASQGLRYLTQLTSLTLNFSKYKESCHDPENYLTITNKGMENLASQGLKYLTQLTSLTLDFCASKDLTDEGVKKLTSQGLRYLTQLTSLSLNFSWCDQITSEGATSLASQGIKYLTQLTSLTLDFSTCKQMTNVGVTNLASQGIKHLNQLTFLTLNFSQCKEVTDEGVASLMSQGIKHLSQLTSLNLNFSLCSQITDEGVNDLIYHIIKYLVQLTSLVFDFSTCDFTEVTVSSVTRALYYFGFIEDHFSQ